MCVCVQSYIHVCVCVCVFISHDILLVDSNDKLYGQDPKFISECSQFCVDLKDETFTLLDVLDKPEVIDVFLLLTLLAPIKIHLFNYTIVLWG